MGSSPCSHAIEDMVEITPRKHNAFLNQSQKNVKQIPGSTVLAIQTDIKEAMTPNSKDL
jgi:hypothetical protein